MTRISPSDPPAMTYSPSGLKAIEQGPNLADPVAKLLLRVFFAMLVTMTVWLSSMLASSSELGLKATPQGGALCQGPSPTWVPALASTGMMRTTLSRQAEAIHWPSGL